MNEMVWWLRSLIILSEVEGLGQSGLASGDTCPQGKQPMRPILGHLAKPRDMIRAH